MNNDNPTTLNQFAWIFNYQPHIEHQTNNFGTPSPVGKTAPNADQQEIYPNFGLDGDQDGIEHWENVYTRLTEKEWIRRSEVERLEWVYVCCGEGTAPQHPIVWHSSTAALAYIIRYWLKDWTIAQSVFCLKDNKMLPPNLKTANSPSEKVCDDIDRIFKTH